MNLKEFESVLNQPANIRYEYFVKKVVDSETVWGLYEDGWAVTKDDNGNVLFPIWPKREFAEHCANNDWENYLGESMDLYEFIDDLLPRLKVDGLKPSIFFNNDDSAVLDVDILIRDLKAELEKY
ncbi:DUF2750 domain-containing protein [Paenibacillus oryzisoli]|uniref:DUF2750 domain-containing protein n=1 Tax=Paenibacillus oryzisoli TaxID=1850517 RepID=A0A198A0J6_9BACL|nr:DUF2750 domain-containing protein [Paenibacillus oryzisoli]OAS14700.1 hypothetical protein A8708_23665 [Paenibacillus oryzisoli]